MHSLGLRAALTLLVLIGLAPVFGVVVQSSLSQQRASLDRAEERLQSLVAVGALQQEALVETARVLLTALAHAPPVVGQDAPACTRYLRQLQANFPPEFVVVGLIDAGGLLSCRSEPFAATVRSSDREFFRRAVSTGRFAVGEFTVSRASGRKVLTFGMPVYSQPDRELRGVVYAAVDTTHAGGNLRRVASTADATLVMADDQGLVLAAAGPLQLDSGGTLPATFLLEALRAQQTGMGRGRDAHGREWLFALHPVGRPGERRLWVAGLMPRDEVLAPLSWQLQQQLGALTFITLVAAALAWTFADRVLLRPMRALLGRVEALEREDQRLDQPAASGVLREFNELHRRFHGMARNLAERAVLRDAAMAEMEHQRLLLESVLESMSEGVLVIDRQGRFVHMNGAALRILPGLRGADRAGATAAASEASWPVFSADGAQACPVQERPAARALRGEGVERFRLRIGSALAGGAEKVIEGSAWPLVMSGPVFDGAVLLFADATDIWRAEEARTRAEEALRNLNETLEVRVHERTRELAVANRELESFSYSVSHDLRAPLQVIDGFARALVSRHGEQLNGQARHYLARICENTRQMGQLIDDLLDLARVTRVELLPQQVDLAAIALRVVDTLRQRNPQREVAVEVQQPLPCQADPRLLAIVMENLLGNAWKFTAHTPHAQVRIGQGETQGGQAVFFVADNGAGFDMAYADKLFNAFQRLHNEAEFEGTGIGLATVHRIVARHGGRAWAQSTPGQGATFFFTLPGGEAAA